MINKIEIVKKAGLILDELKEQYQYISGNPDKLNPLELELFAANAEYLSENLKVLKKLTTEEKPLALPQPSQAHQDLPSLSTQNHPDISQGQPKPAIQQAIPVHADTSAQSSAYSAKPAIPQDPILQEASVKETPVQPSVIIKEQPALSNAVHVEAPLPPAQPEVQAQPLRPNPAQQVVQAEAASEPLRRPSINQMFSTQKEKDSPAAHAPRVSDLKSIISLNDKLIFIKELFNGYSLAYSEAIELLNRFDSFEAADNFLKFNYAEKNNWASKQATVSKFYSLLSKRFPY